VCGKRKIIKEVEEKMSKVIIGVHGLANKPKKSILEKWWKQSIAEGLKINASCEKNFTFKMVYWADKLYKYRIHQDEKFKFDALYNDEPYVEADPDDLVEKEDDIWDTLHAMARGMLGTAADVAKEKFEMDGFADWVLGKCLKDLAFYYSDEPLLVGDNGEPALARDVLRGILRSEIQQVIDNDPEAEIMLIPHSMGTIISYDVLREIGRKENNTIEIPHLVTIGSPLGLPHVLYKIKKESGDHEVRTPTIVTKSWLNFADKKDIVAADFKLRGDYKVNKNNVQVVDDLVYNTYHTIDSVTGKEKSNHHKSYGYLRTPEVSWHIRNFLEGEI
jgi:hypothetical protein